MKRRWRVILLLSVLSALLGGLSYAYPTWTQDAGLDFWNFPALEAELATETRLEQEFVHKREVVHNTLAYRSGVTDDLIAGHITLDEAAAQFLAFNEADPQRGAATRLFFPAPTLAESTRQQLLSFVAARLTDPCCPRGTLSIDLQSELDTYLRSHTPGPMH